MSDIGACDQCGESLRQTLAANEAFLEAARKLRQSYPNMSVRLRPRPHERLLCVDCQAAGHQVLRPVQELTDVLAPLEEEEWMEAGGFLEDER